MTGIEGYEKEKYRGIDAIKLRDDYFQHFRFTEKDGGLLVDEARRLHAQGYLSLGFVEPTAIESDGSISADLDKARGGDVIYYLAYDEHTGQYASTMRKIAISNNRHFTSLPAIGLCRESFSSGSLEMLSEIDSSKAQLLELAALAGDPKAGYRAIYESLRNGLHDGIQKNEVWIFSLVASTHDSLVKNMGAEVFTVLGNDVKIEDHRVSDNVRLRPLLLDTSTFLETLLGTCENEDISDSDRMRYLKSFIFFSDGLGKDAISERVYNARRNLRNLA